MTDLASLIAELEAAETGSFLLDFKVWCAIHGHTPDFNRSEQIIGWYLPKGCDHVTLADWWPALTSDLDDVRCYVVPDGMLWRAGSEGAGVGFAGVKGRWWYSDKEDPALALCIAAFKAREAG